MFRSGFVNVWRNSFVSLASIFVMAMTLIIVGILMFMSALIGQFVTYLENKVDINVYFVEKADERTILDLKATLEGFPDVASVTYLSREDALTTFRARHQDNQLIVQSLDELGENPLGAQLSIKAKETSQYEGIARFLGDKTLTDLGEQFIDRVNYGQNKAVIDQLTAVSRNVEQFGFVVMIIFILASILITFNTIRLAIYTSREEISVMRLVGATNMYIRGPFIVEGTVYGLVAGLIALVLLVPLAYSLKGTTEMMFTVDIFSYYLTHMHVYFGVLLGTGALLGAVSSYLAVRKYLSI